MMCMLVHSLDCWRNTSCITSMGRGGGGGGREVFSWMNTSCITSMERGRGTEEGEREGTRGVGTHLEVCGCSSLFTMKCMTYDVLWKFRFVTNYNLQVLMDSFPRSTALLSYTFVPIPRYLVPIPCHPIVPIPHYPIAPFHATYCPHSMLPCSHQAHKISLCASSPYKCRHHSSSPDPIEHNKRSPDAFLPTTATTTTSLDISACAYIHVVYV